LPFTAPAFFAIYYSTQGESSATLQNLAFPGLFFKNDFSTPKIPLGFQAKLGTFGPSWRNHFSQNIECKK
jgi:hypothetical protein